MIWIPLSPTVSNAPKYLIAEQEELEMKSSIIGLDIVKRVFHVYTIQADGKVFKKMLRRKQVLEFFDNYPSSLIGIEACSSSHYWARELTTLDYEVKKGSCRPRVCENSRFTNSVEK